MKFSVCQICYPLTLEPPPNQTEDARTFIYRGNVQLRGVQKVHLNRLRRAHFNVPFSKGVCQVGYILIGVCQQIRFLGCLSLKVS